MATLQSKRVTSQAFVEGAGHKNLKKCVSISYKLTKVLLKSGITFLQKDHIPVYEVTGKESGHTRK